MKDLSKHYGQLSCEERFKLVLAALARDDEAEAQNLKRTCPQKQYMMSDAAYGDMLDASRDIVLSMAIDFLVHERECLIRRLRINDFCNMIKAYDMAFTNATGQPFFKGELRIPEDMQTNLERAAGSLKAIASAFDSFVQSLGLEVEQFAAWFPPLAEWIDYAKDLPQVDPDPDTLERTLQALRTYWRERTERGDHDMVR